MPLFFGSKIKVELIVLDELERHGAHFDVSQAEHMRVLGHHACQITDHVQVLGSEQGSYQVMHRTIVLSKEDVRDGLDYGVLQEDVF